MPIFNPKHIIQKLLLAQGYDLSIHRCTNEPYNGPKIAFIHIAKCGGISVDTALRCAFAKPKQRSIDRKATLASSHSSFNHPITSIEQACDFSEHHAKTLQQIFHYYLSLHWQYVSGHVATNSRTLSQYKDEYAFITMLRDPVERFISNYIFNKLTNSLAIMPPNNLTTDNLIVEAKELLTSRRGWHMAHIPTMCITGSFPKDKEHAKVLHNVFSQNIAQFKVVGFLSQLDKFNQDIKDTTGKILDIQHKNSVGAIRHSQKENISDTLKTFFNDKTTQKELNKLCYFEIMNYQSALNSHG